MRKIRTYQDVTHDTGSGLLEQVMDQQQRLANRLAQVRSVVAIASGKGGVGKSNIAVNLAIALSELDFRVILVDADIGLANACVLLGIKPRATLLDVLLGEYEIEDALTPAPGGIELLAGSTGVKKVSDLDPEQKNFLIRRFKKLTASADFVIIDTGAGITGNVLHFAAAADQLIVVTAPEPSAITDGYALIKTVEREKGHGQIGLVCNEATTIDEGSKVCKRLKDICLRFLDLGIRDLGCVRFDEKVKRAVRDRKPFLLQYPNCPASVDLRKLAEIFHGIGAGNTGEAKIL